MNALVEKANQIGSRKLGAFYAILGFCVLFTLTRALLPIWIDGMGSLDDIPTNVMYIIIASASGFFAINGLAKFAPSVKSGAQPS